MISSIVFIPNSQILNGDPFIIPMDPHHLLFRKPEGAEIIGDDPFFSQEAAVRGPGKEVGNDRASGIIPNGIFLNGPEKVCAERRRGKGRAFRNQLDLDLLSQPFLEFP